MNNINPVHAAFAVALVVVAIPSLGNLREFNSDVKQARMTANRIGDDMTELSLAQQEAEQKSEVAEQRYKDGCLPVVSPSQTDYVTLIKNQPVIDSGSGAPLPDGTVVCDAHGNTATLVNDDDDDSTPAVAQAFAFTGNKAVVDERLRNFQGARYSMPQN